MKPELARQVAERLMACEGTAGAWHLVLEEAREGYARVSMRVRADMLNGHRTAHGGMIFALADSAFAYACNNRNEATVAQQASIHFLAPAQEGDVLVAEAREEARIGRTGSYSGAVRTKEGRTIAQFQGLSRTIGGAVLPTQEQIECPTPSSVTRCERPSDATADRWRAFGRMISLQFRCAR